MCFAALSGWKISRLHGERMLSPPSIVPKDISDAPSRWKLKDAIRSLAPSNVMDPFTHPATLSRAVSMGILDAPHLQNEPFARGRIAIRIDRRGACVTVEPGIGKPISEKGQLSELAWIQLRSATLDSK